MPQSPFERPAKFPAHGDEDAATVYTAVGLALTHWEILEDSFAHLFSGIVSPSKLSYPAKRAYGSITTARGRKEMIVAAAEVYFRNFPNAELDTQLNGLMKDYDKASARRNDFAHGVVAGHTWEGRRKFSGYYLGPNFWNTNKRGARLEPSFIYNSELINGYINHFHGLGVRCRETQSEMRKNFISSSDHDRRERH